MRGSHAKIWEERGRKFQAGRACAKVLKQEQAWLTQEAAKREVKMRLKGCCQRSCSPASQGRCLLKVKNPEEQVHQTSSREGNQLASIAKGL